MRSSSLPICLLAVWLALLPFPAWAAGPSRETDEERWLFLPKHQPWIAASLSLACNGLGQFYNGEPEKGRTMLAGWLTFPLALGVDSLTGGSFVRVFSLGANAVIKIWSVTDAYQRAGPLPSPAPSP